MFTFKTTISKKQKHRLLPISSSNHPHTRHDNRRWCCLAPSKGVWLLHKYREAPFPSVSSAPLHSHRRRDSRAMLQVQIVCRNSEIPSNATTVRGCDVPARSTKHTIGCNFTSKFSMFVRALGGVINLIIHIVLISFTAHRYPRNRSNAVHPFPPSLLPSPHQPVHAYSTYLRNLCFFFSQICCLDFSHDGWLLCSVGADSRSTVNVWDWRKGEAIARVQAGPIQINAFRFNPYQVRP